MPHLNSCVFLISYHPETWNCTHNTHNYECFHFSNLFIGLFFKLITKGFVRCCWVNFRTISEQNKTIFLYVISMDGQVEARSMAMSNVCKADNIFLEVFSYVYSDLWYHHCMSRFKNMFSIRCRFLDKQTVFTSRKQKTKCLPLN